MIPCSAVAFSGVRRRARTASISSEVSAKAAAVNAPSTGRWHPPSATSRPPSGCGSSYSNGGLSSCDASWGCHVHRQTVRCVDVQYIAFVCAVGHNQAALRHRGAMPPTAESLASAARRQRSAMSLHRWGSPTTAGARAAAATRRRAAFSDERRGAGAAGAQPCRSTAQLLDPRAITGALSCLRSTEARIRN